MLGGDIALALVIVERDAVAGLDDEEGPEAYGRRQAEDLCEERRGCLLVSTPDNRVVELHAHEDAADWERRSPSTTSSTRSL